MLSRVNQRRAAHLQIPNGESGLAAAPAGEQKVMQLAMNLGQLAHVLRASLALSDVARRGLVVAHMLQQLMEDKLQQLWQPHYLAVDCVQTFASAIAVETPGS